MLKKGLFFLTGFWKKHKLPWRIVTAIFAIIIFILCIIGVENLPRSIFFMDFIDVIYHFCGFFLFGLLLAGSFYEEKKALKISLATGIIWGIICESVQILTPWRSFVLLDLAANMSGVTISQLLIIKLLNFVKI